MIYVFDLDGTLINSKRRHKILFRDILKKINFKINNKNLNYYMIKKCNGISTKFFCENILKLSNEKTQKIMTLWLNNIENKKYIKFDKIYYETNNILKSLSCDNEIYYLTARNNKNNLIYELKKLKIFNYAKKIYIVNPMNARNEKTEILKKLKEINDKIVFIGDTEIDYFSAKNSNTKYYLLNRGFRSKDYWDRLNEISYRNINKILSEIK